MIKPFVDSLINGVLQQSYYFTARGILLQETIYVIISTHTRIRHTSRTVL